MQGGEERKKKGLSSRAPLLGKGEKKREKTANYNKKEGKEEKHMVNTPLPYFPWARYPKREKGGGIEEPLVSKFLFFNIGM